MSSGSDFKEMIERVCAEKSVSIDYEGDLMPIPDASRKLNLRSSSTMLSAAATNGRIPFIQVAPKKRIVSVEICKMYMDRASPDDLKTRWEEILKERGNIK